MNKLICISLSAMLLSGCATTSYTINRASIGMTREEVIKAMGQPHSKAAQGNTEIYKYNLYQPMMGGILYNDMQPPDEYFVRFINGRVESFGATGDFDSTKDPTLNVNLNTNQRVIDRTKGEKQ